MNGPKELLTTTQKALTINLDGPKYGTFAEKMVPLPVALAIEGRGLFGYAGDYLGATEPTIDGLEISEPDSPKGPQ
jgi:hypothetical protein